MWRSILEICGVECGSRGKSGPKFDVFCASNFEGALLPKFLCGVVNRHHFRPTGQVWLRFHGWSFIYADEIKKIWGRFFPKFLQWIVGPLSRLTFGKIWLAWVQWPLCGKPGTDAKCRIFIGWVTMRRRILAISGSKVMEGTSPCRGQIVDWH